MRISMFQSEEVVRHSIRALTGNEGCDTLETCGVVDNPAVEGLKGLIATSNETGVPKYGCTIDPDVLAFDTSSSVADVIALVYEHAKCPK